MARSSVRSSSHCLLGWLLIIPELKVCHRCRLCRKEGAQPAHGKNKYQNKLYRRGGQVDHMVLLSEHNQCAIIQCPVWKGAYRYLNDKNVRKRFRYFSISTTRTHENKQ